VFTVVVDFHTIVKTIRKALCNQRETPPYPVTRLWLGYIRVQTTCDKMTKFMFQFFLFVFLLFVVAAAKCGRYRGWHWGVPHSCVAAVRCGTVCGKGHKAVSNKCKAPKTATLCINCVENGSGHRIGHRVQCCHRGKKEGHGRGVRGQLRANCLPRQFVGTTDLSVWLEHHTPLGQMQQIIVINF